MSGQDGFRLIDKIRRTKFVGETGSVILDEDTGTRTNLTFSVLRMTKMGFVPDAVWSESTGYMKSKGKFVQTSFFISLIYSRLTKYLMVSEVASNGPGVSGPAELEKQSLNIVSVLSDPYTMVKLDAVAVGRSGNDKYEGFAVDLINEIAAIVEFNFTLVPVAGYGSHREDGSWTGMIGELLGGTADMAIGDMRELLQILLLSIMRGTFTTWIL